MAVNRWYLFAPEPDEHVCDCLACCCSMKLVGKLHQCTNVYLEELFFPRDFHLLL